MPLPISPGNLIPESMLRMLIFDESHSLFHGRAAIAGGNESHEATARPLP